MDRRHIVGAITYLLGSTFTVYVILKHNLAGVCFVSFFGQCANRPSLRWISVISMGTTDGIRRGG